VFLRVLYTFALSQEGKPATLSPTFESAMHFIREYTTCTLIFAGLVSVAEKSILKSPERYILQPE
jgi:hypothetical protein